MVLCLLVSKRFQVLFHSPPGVLFTFPSRYYTLSVIRSYLALEDGPPVFKQDFACPALLWILTVQDSVSVTGLSPSLVGFSNTVLLLILTTYVSPKPLRGFPLKFGLLLVRSPLLK